METLVREAEAVRACREILIALDGPGQARVVAVLEDWLVGPSAEATPVVRLALGLAKKAA